MSVSSKFSQFLALRAAEACDCPFAMHGAKRFRVWTVIKGVASGQHDFSMCEFRRVRACKCVSPNCRLGFTIQACFVSHLAIQPANGTPYDGSFRVHLWGCG